MATDRIDNPLVRHSNFIQDSGRWDDFKFRPDDIVISTPPKCGTSWAQMITALLIFQKPGNSCTAERAVSVAGYSYKAQTSGLRRSGQADAPQVYQDSHTPLGVTDSRWGDVLFHEGAPRRMARDPRQRARPAPVPRTGRHARPTGVVGLDPPVLTRHLHSPIRPCARARGYHGVARPHTTSAPSSPNSPVARGPACPSHTSTILRPANARAVDD